jgi:tetratricopeptide (TPR) repeat protein
MTTTRGLLPALVLGLSLVLGAAPARAADSVAGLRAAARHPPSDPVKALELGRSLGRAGLYGEALRVLRHGYFRAGKDKSTAIQLRLQAARTLIAERKQKAALRECRGLRPLSPVKADACTAEAQLLWRRASLALPAAERALSSSPHDYDALVAKGRALEQMGKPTEAQAAFRAAIAADGSRYEAHRYLAALLYEGGGSKAGLAELRTAARLGPDEPALLVQLASQLPAGKEAETLLKHALSLRPDYGAALAQLGENQLEQGQLAPAAASLKRALAIDPKQADWHADLGRVLLAQGDADKALAEAKQALSIVHNHAAGKLLEADALAARGDIDPAIEAYEKAHALSRTSPEALVHAARACLHGARPTTAHAFASRATQDFPDWAPGWEALGDVLAAGQEPKAARDAYTKALKAHGPVDRKGIQKKLARIR